MPKSQTKLPKVFLACPFDKDMTKLVETLNWLPWTIKVANERITSDHILAKIVSDMGSCDFAIFDISVFTIQFTPVFIVSFNRTFFRVFLVLNHCYWRRSFAII